MKRKSPMVLPCIILLSMLMTSCPSDNNEGVPPTLPPDPNLLNEFWFGYRQEDPLTNPEDPGTGFIYLRIPESGSFEGELYFSYSGCVEGVDIGRADGIVNNESLTGSWQGNVDGKNVGGDYMGQLVNDGAYQGTYTNTGGKIEVVCDSDFSYFIAPNGTWSLQRTGNNEALNLTVDTDSDPLVLAWDGGADSGLFYSVVFVDAECLEQNLDLEECLMWSGVSTTNSIVYGQGIADIVPARRLVLGKSYLASITCINSEGEATVSSNIIFTR